MLTEENLAKARSDGYSDEEIQKDMVAKFPKMAVNFKNGYTLDEIAKDFTRLQNTNQADAGMLKAINASRALSGKSPVASLHYVANEDVTPIKHLPGVEMFMTVPGQKDLLTQQEFENQSKSSFRQTKPEMGPGSATSFSAELGVETPQFTIKPEDNVVSAATKAAANNIIGLVDFAISPVGIGLAALGGVAVGTSKLAPIAKVGGRLVGAKFTVDLAKSFGEQLAIATDNTKTPAERTAAGVNATAAALGGWMSAYHAATGKSPIGGKAEREKADTELRQQLKQISTEHLEAFLADDTFKKKWQYDPKLIEAELLERRGQQTTPETSKAAAEIVKDKTYENINSENTKAKEMLVQRTHEEQKPTGAGGLEQRSQKLQDGKDNPTPTEIVKDKPEVADSSIQTSPLVSAAIKNDDGTISTGKSEEAAKRAEEHGQLTTDETPERLHSSNLEPTDEKYQPSVSKDQQSVVKGLAEDAKAKLGPGAANADEFKQLAEEQSHELAAIGADKLLSGSSDKSSWKAAMLEEFPYAEEKDLNKIWRDTKDLLENFESSKKTPQARSTKFQVDLATGVRQIRASARDSISKAKAFIEYLKGRQKGGEEGRKQATKELRFLDKWMEAKRNELVAGLIQLAKKGDVQGKVINAILKTVVRPDIARGDFDSMARKAEQAANIIQGFADRKQRIGLQNTIQESAKSVLDSPSVSVHVKQLLREALPNLETKAELQKLSLPELEALQSQIAKYKELGIQEWSDLKSAREGMKLLLENKLKADSHATPIKLYEKIVKESPGNWWEKVQDNLQNTVKAVANFQSTFEKISLTTARLCELFDGRRNGWLTENFYKPIFTCSRGYYNGFNPIRDSITGLIEKHDLKTEDAIKIGIFSHFEQNGTEAELYHYSTDRQGLSRLLSEMGGKLGADKQNLKLSEGQKAVYDYCRKIYDNDIPDLVKYFADHHNVELKLVDKYSARILDSRKSDKWYDEQLKAKGSNPKSGEQIDRDEIFNIFKDTLSFSERETSNIKKGFAEERKPKAEIPLNLDFIDAFLKHQDNWQYVKNYQPHLDLMRKLINTSTFLDKYGVAGRKFYEAYTTALARRGQYSKAGWEMAMSYIQNKAMVGVLGLRPTQLKHVSNYPVGMYEAGGHENWGHGWMVKDSVEGEAYLRKYAPEIFKATGGDITTGEAQQDKLTRAFFKIDTMMDFNNRASTFMGSIFDQMQKSGQDWHDWSKVEPTEDMVNNARLAYTFAVGSPEVADRPLLVTSKLAVGSPVLGKALAAYKGPILVRWGLLRHALFKKDTIGNKATELGILGASSLLEAAVQVGSKKAYIVAAAGIMSLIGIAKAIKQTKQFNPNAPIKEGKKDETESLTKEFLTDASKDFLGTPPILGDVVKRSITAAQYPRAEDRILSQTGIPPIDLTYGTLHDAVLAVIHPDRKHIVDAGMSVLMSAGKPVSIVQQVVHEIEKEMPKPPRESKASFNPEKQPK